MDLSSIPVIDQHTAPILNEETVQSIPLAAALTHRSATDSLSPHAQQTLSYRRSLRDIATLFHCDATEEAIQHHRSSVGLDQITQTCFDAAHLNAIFLDDGPWPQATQSLEWHQQKVQSYRLIRLEYLAEKLMAEVDRFDVFLEWFRSEIDPLPNHAIGFKSVAACRTGLDIQFVYQDIAEESFFRLKQHQAESSTPIPALDKALSDYLLLEALNVAAKYGVPIQFHTGFGNSSLDLRLSNPLHLRPILEEPQYASVPIVLLNGSYPFTREAGFLSSQYLNTYVDFGRAILLLNIQGMRQVIGQIMELTPMTKILYSSGAQCIPEQVYLGAKWGRDVLGQVLDASIQDGDLTVGEAENGAIAILHQNARTLYRIP